VTAIPCSAFYLGEKTSTNMVRFAFCKSDEDMEKARILMKDLVKKYKLE
jgi:aspartate/methionine/tyrosine aminotransferase